MKKINDEKLLSKSNKMNIKLIIVVGMIFFSLISFTNVLLTLPSWKLVCVRNVWKVMNCGSNFVLAWKWSMNMKCEYVWNAVFPTHTFQYRCIINLSEGRVYTIFRIHTCHKLLISNSKCRWYRISANVWIWSDSNYCFDYTRLFLCLFGRQNISIVVVNSHW